MLECPFDLIGEIVREKHAYIPWKDIAGMR